MADSGFLKVISAAKLQPTHLGQPHSFDSKGTVIRVLNKVKGQATHLRAASLVVCTERLAQRLELGRNSENLVENGTKT